MKSIRKHKKVLALTAAVLFSAPVFAGGAGDKKDKNETLNYEQLDPFYDMDHQSLSKTLVFYDSEDNLVHEAVLEHDEYPNLEVIKLLNGSDLMVENNKISYFRLNK